LIKGKPLNLELIEEAAKLALTEISPISDVRASKEYRYDVVEVTIRRSLEQFMQGGAVS
jgi:carbon-monoxide dehydrogenase medium subunit